jgi:hypothetical protein
MSDYDIGELERRIQEPDDPMPRYEDDEDEEPIYEDDPLEEEGPTGLAAFYSMRFR